MFGFNAAAVCNEYHAKCAQLVRTQLQPDRRERDSDDSLAQPTDTSDYFDRPADLARRHGKARGKSWVIF